MNEPGPAPAPPVVDDDKQGGSCGCYGGDGEKSTSKRPRYTKITQQELGACKPVLTKTAVTLIFICVAVVFLPIGGVCLAYGLKAKEQVFRYDDVCAHGSDPQQNQQYLWNNTGNTSALTCNMVVTLDQDFSGTVYMYYQINGMYQNYRRYARSRIDQQLAGQSGWESNVGYVRSHIDEQLAGQSGWESNVGSETQAQSCVPLIYDVNGNLIFPCGLVAWSLFNDTYQVSNLDTHQLQVPIDNSTAFTSDVTYRFADLYPQYFNEFLNSSRGGAQIVGTLKQDQQLMVWMRLSHMPKFRKLWANLGNQNWKAGQRLSLSIVNQYNTYSFSGSKYVVLSTTTWLGGSSIFLGVAYLVTGGMSLLFALIYLIIVVAKPRKFADTSRLRSKPHAHAGAAAT